MTTKISERMVHARIGFARMFGRISIATCCATALAATALVTGAPMSMAQQDATKGASSATEAQVVRLYAAGSLKGALSRAAGMFAAPQAGAVKIESEFGPSGLLRERIEKGESAHVFASADMTHPQKLAEKGLTDGPPRVFIRNAMCLLTRKDLAGAGRAPLDMMLDPALRLGVSTPKSDPAGDYALEVFKKAEALKPGAEAALNAKAQQLSGGPTSPTAPEGRNTYGWLISSNQADVYLTYCSNGLAAARDTPEVSMMPLPPELATKASYGIVVLKGAPPAAAKLADFLLSSAGQNVLSFGFGFEAVGP